MEHQGYIFNSKIDYGDLKDEIHMTSGQDVHLAAVIKLATSYNQLDDTTKFDLHKIATACGFASSEQMIFSIHALSHLFVALMTSSLDLMNGLHDKLGPPVVHLCNTIKTSNEGGPAWTSLKEIIEVVMRSTENSMNGRPLSTQPAVDPSRLN